MKAAPARFGLRAQLLLGLGGVALFAVLSSGALALWAAGDNLREQRESTAASLVTAAAAVASAALDLDRPLNDALNARALRGVLTTLRERSGVAELSVLGPDRRVVLALPPRAPRDEDLPVLTAVLSGVPAALNYRKGSSAATELVAYAAIEARGRLLGAIRIVVPAPAPVPAFLARSGPLLVLLACGDVLLLVLLVHTVLTILVVRPLREVERATALVSSGDWTQRVGTAGPREIASLADSFNRMTVSLAQQREQLIRSEKLASVGQLAAGVAHEIGNPLAAILGYTDLLRAELIAAGAAHGRLTPAERVDIAERIKSETQRIHRTIQDLLAYSRPEREGAVPTDAREVLYEARNLLVPQARFRGVEVVVEPAATAWPPLLVAPDRLKQVFVNLLLNAADAMEGAGRVDVRAAPRAGHVRIEFADQGPGVASGLERRIFDPFFSTKEPGRGTGLGLPICRSIIESYGGTLELEPTPAGERGARFVVTLPMAG